MHATFFALAAVVAGVTAQGIQPAPSATVSAAPGTLQLGAECASTEQCANGAECFASNAWGTKSCGKFNAACTSDSQCATNTCNNGLCNGFLSSSSAVASSTVAATNGIQAAPSATVSAAAGSLQLGAECASTDQCANGAECFASNAWGIKSCGKYNAACTSDSQCATNTCNNGLCNGFLSSSSVASASSTLVTSVATNGIQAAPSATVSAAAGSLALGAECASTDQCANGAECFASTAWQIKSCGKFNAACTLDSQCATNTCNNGLCNGFLASSAYASGAASTATPSAVVKPAYNSTGSANSTSVSTNGTAAPTQAVYTGAASKAAAGFSVAFAAVGFAFALIL